MSIWFEKFLKYFFAQLSEFSHSLWHFVLVIVIGRDFGDSCRLRMDLHEYLRVLKLKKLRLKQTYYTTLARQHRCTIEDRKSLSS